MIIIYVTSCLGNLRMNLDGQSLKRLRTMKENAYESKDGENPGGPIRRTLHVEAIGVTKAVPDLCHILIKIVSQKVTVSQAKDSVDRRLAYVRQTIQNCQIQVLWCNMPCSQPMSGNLFYSACF